MPAQRIKRSPTLQWVPLDQMQVSKTAQRDERPGFIAKLVANMDLDALGYPVVSHRDGVFWIIDGQHRIAAMRMWAGPDQLLECEVFEGLTEAQEADEFLQRQTRLNTRPIDAFRIAVTAGRHDECEIDAVVRNRRLAVSASGAKNAIQAVAVLRAIYRDGGPSLLDRSIALAVGAFLHEGRQGYLIRAASLVLLKYTSVPDEVFRLKLSRAPFQEVFQRANAFKAALAKPTADCWAAAMIETMNAGRGPKYTGYFANACGVCM